MSSSLIESPGTFRPMMRLAMPVLAEQVLHLLVELVDLWLTGNFLDSHEYVAAMTVMLYTLWLLGMSFGMIFYGASALTARFTGAGNHDLANRVMIQSLQIGAIYSAALMLVCLPLAPQFAALMGLEGKAAEAATRYLTIELCVLPAIMVERVGISCLRGAGDTASGLLVMGVVNVVNMATSYWLVTGWGRFPELGWTGLALGTAIGHAVGATIILLMLAAGRAGFHLRIAALDFTLIRRILRVGIPGGMDALLICICHLTFLRVVTSLGVDSVAAHGAAIQIEALAFMPGGAFQIAASTMTGQYLGAKDPERAMRSVIACTAAASSIMAASGVAFYVYASELSAFFLSDKSPAVVELAAGILHVVAIAMIPLAIAMVVSGALRGAGDTRVPMAITVIGMLLVRVPLAYYLANGHTEIPLLGIPFEGLGWGVIGAWYAVVIDIVLRAVLFVGRLLQGGWKLVEV